MIMAKHKTAIKITLSTITDSTDRQSNMCILISIFYFRIFFPVATHGNEDAGSVQYFILLFWCKSKESGGRVSPRCPCVTPVVESFSSDLLRAIISYWLESHLDSC